MSASISATKAPKVWPKLPKLSKRPFVTICTPTYNRRPFIPHIVACFLQQTYPHDRMEWIIVDDGTDLVGDLVAHIPQIVYVNATASDGRKLTLGQKRNLTHERARGEIIVYMDDDDYYPPERVAHAVQMLQQTPRAWCAGSSEMHIWFKHNNSMVQFGPYGPRHATAATFAFRRELLQHTGYDPTASVAEEPHFLQAQTVPFVQLDTRKTILVFSHNHNSFDKKTLLEGGVAPTTEKRALVRWSPYRVEDFIVGADQVAAIRFYVDEVDAQLAAYDPGRLQNKPDVVKQLVTIQQTRDERRAQAAAEADLNVRGAAAVNALMMRMKNPQPNVGTAPAAIPPDITLQIRIAQLQQKIIAKAATPVPHVAGQSCEVYYAALTAQMRQIVVAALAANSTA